MQPKVIRAGCTAERPGPLRSGLARRPSAAAAADRIVKEDSHDALIAANGLYARLYRMNYATFDDIPPEELERVLADVGQRT